MAAICLLNRRQAAATLGIDGARLLRDPETDGVLFESLVYQHLLVCSQPLDGTDGHYRDSTGVEVGPGELAALGDLVRGPD